MKKIIFKFFEPFLIVISLLWFRNIWNMKQHLQKRSKPNSLLLAIYHAYFNRYGSWIGYESELQDIPRFPHGMFGIFISNGAKIGSNAIIFHQVTIGSDTLADSNHAGSPRIGNHVYIGAGAKIIGNITIGDNCRIGANAVVYQDMAPHSVAVQAPTRIIQKANLDNRFIPFAKK